MSSITVSKNETFYDIRRAAMFAGVHPTSSQSRTVIDGFMTGGKRTSVSYIFFHKYRTPLRGMTAQKAKNVKRPPARGAGGPS